MRLRVTALFCLLFALLTLAGCLGGNSTSTTSNSCPVPTSGGQPCAADSLTPPPNSPIQHALPLTVPGPLTTYANGQFPSSALAPATGCSHGLAKPAAAAWNYVAVKVHNATGYWLQSNGDASCYRTLGQQIDLRNYWCNLGQCGNAAVPGTSNHGWGLAVDAPPQTVAYIHQYAGGLFGQGYGSCSDAPWESWHIKYCGGYSGPDPGAYGSGGGGQPKHHFDSLKRGDKGQRVKELSTHLAILRRTTPSHDHYIKWKNRSVRFNKVVAYGVRRLQRDCHLHDDGVYGPKTHRCEVHRWHAHKAGK